MIVFINALTPHWTVVFIGITVWYFQSVRGVIAGTMTDCRSVQKELIT